MPPPAPPSPVHHRELLTPLQIARAVQLSRRTIGAYTASRRIPVIRLGTRTLRYDLEAVLAALKKFEIRAVS